MKLNIKLPILALAAISIFSCKEQAVGDLTKQVALDTTYVGSIPTAQLKNYYIEEFSGVRCVNCPDGATVIEELITQNPDRLVSVTIHAGDLTSPNYNKGSLQSFKTEDGESILSIIYGGDPGKPCASFDRVAIANSSPVSYLNRNYNQWATALSQVKTAHPTTPVNVDVTSTFNSTEGVYDIKVKLSYNQSVTDPQSLTVYLIENKIIDQQLSPEIANYEFNHVFRSSITPFNGSPILDSLTTKEAGRVLEKTFKYKIDPNSEIQKFWKPENMKVVAFVHNPSSNTDKRVIQAKQISLK